MVETKLNNGVDVVEQEGELSEPDKVILDRITALENENKKLKSKITLFEKLKPVEEPEIKKPLKSPEESVLKELEKRGWIF